MMDRKTLLALVLCLVIPIAWQRYILKEYPNATATSVQASAQQASGDHSTGNGSGSGNANSPLSLTSASQEIKPVAPHNAPVRPSKKLTLKTGIGNAEIGDSQNFFVDWGLKDYKLGISPQAASVDLHSLTHQPGEINLAFEDPSLAYLNDVQGTLTPTDQGALWTYEDSNVSLKREFIANENKPYVNVKVTADFKTKHPKFAFITLAAQTFDQDPEAQDRSLLYWTNDSLERIHLKEDLRLKEVGTPVKYIAAANRYFLFSAVAESNPSPNALIQPAGTAGSGRVSLVYQVTGNSITIPFKAYFGPKELNVLRQVDPTLDHTVDFGWFTVFAYPLLTLLKWLYQFLQNYGLAIIVLTLLLKLVTYPLTYKSMKSMKKMAKMQPQLQRLREKYKDDKEGLNREMLTLMKSGGYNPMAGCLPILIQMPIFFALYRVLYSSIELYHAPFAFWIRDLSSHDPFYVTPILMTAAMFLQQKLTPSTATDPAQAKMMLFMPVVFGGLMMALPSGLTIYMLVNSVAGILQQFILNKKLNEPSTA